MSPKAGAGAVVLAGTISTSSLDPLPLEVERPAIRQHLAFRSTPLDLNAVIFRYRRTSSGHEPVRDAARRCTSHRPPRS
jgi:hypothetical protein